ncbi:MAG: GNAT family N-acetyltransferase [Candidatus Lokiarchaeota archaeon]|nr:GNAT family N-acetyltransferase [Candidatus Lokiarchaeota archaeon]
MKGNFKIRKLTEEDREAYRKLMRYAFETSKNNYEEIRYPSDKTPMYPMYYAAFDDDLMVAGAGMIPFEIRMRSQEFKMYGVAGVASKPEYRNKGIIREIMIEMFKDMHENNIPISVLYPFKHSFYEMLGYKLVDERFYYQFKTSDIIYKDTNYTMKEVVRIDDDIRSVYDKAILNFDYIAKRPQIGYWRDHYKNNYKFICFNGNQPVGYVILYFATKNDSFLKSPEKTIIIRETFWLDQNAKQTIFNFLWSHRDQRKYIASTFPKHENVMDLLKTPRIERRIIGDNSQLRIIDVKTVLENLKYPRDNFSITFRVKDEFCSWNNGVINIKSKEKEINVEFHESSNDSVDIEINIGHLAQLLAGFRSPKDLLDFGFISVNNNKIKLLQDLFPLTNNYLHDFF